jgi:hypothetical protein
MDATPISFDSALPIGDPPAPPGGPRPTPAGLRRKWVALNEAAALVAGLAGASPTPPAQVQGFSEALADASRWQRELAAQAVADLAAIMEPGLSALIAVHASGADPKPAARALWQEFVSARDALLALTLPRD